MIFKIKIVPQELVKKNYFAKMMKIKIEKNRCHWSNTETKELLSIMKENKIMDLLDGKTRRNNSVYVHLADELAKKGFHKSGEQVKLKFRTLKKEFLQVKRNNAKSGAGRKVFEHYNDMNELLGDRPIAAAVGLDTTFEIIIEDNVKEEITEESLDENLPDPNKPSTSQISTKTSSKKRSAVQNTLLEIATEIKESHQSVINTIREENNSFLAEERRLYVEYVKDIKTIMEEDRRETKEMLKELLNK